MMRLSSFFAALVGIAALGWIFYSHGVAPILTAFESAGLGLVLVAGVRAVETCGAGLAWRALLKPDERPPVTRFLLLRYIRESINCLLPVAQVGGDLVGARLLAFSGIRPGLAGASVLVDLLMQTVTQALFTLIGLFVLIAFDGDSELVRAVAFGLFLLVLGLAGFFVFQRFGGGRLIERVIERLSGDPKWSALGGLDLHESLVALYGDRRRLARGTAIHLAIWFFGVFEVYIALHAMGYPVTYAQALVLESLSQAVRGAAFAVPGAIGVQEGGFIALCAVFGIPFPVAVALSFVKRVPEIVLGPFGLVSWHVLEGRRGTRPVTKSAAQTVPAAAHRLDRAIVPH